jgi:hypothetical protein
MEREKKERERKRWGEERRGEEGWGSCRRNREAVGGSSLSWFFTSLIHFETDQILSLKSFDIIRWCYFHDVNVTSSIYVKTTWVNFNQNILIFIFSQLQDCEPSTTLLVIIALIVTGEFIITWHYFSRQLFVTFVLWMLNSSLIINGVLSYFQF